MHNKQNFNIGLLIIPDSIGFKGPGRPKKILKPLEKPKESTIKRK